MAYNAGDIRKKIEGIVEETGCGKVNIIAHSKGGLDSRYAISNLGAAPMVASLTTINTPHRDAGSWITHAVCRKDCTGSLPDALTGWFGRFGDSHPDFYTATHQFSTDLSRRFNETVRICPGYFTRVIPP